MGQRPWHERSTAAKVGPVALAVLELALTAAAQIDLTRRPADRVAGPKPLWRVVSLINLVGPLAYFRWGRRTVR